MNIDESEILKYESEGFVNENLALACLLAANVVFLNELDVNATYGKKSDNTEWTTCIYVGCNDVFAWACADGESIRNSDGGLNSEIISLYKLWKENNLYGPVKWVCVKRNQQPQPPLKKMMQDAGYWDNTLETLRANDYWRNDTALTNNDSRNIPDNQSK
jgi:hypothetical protein